MLFDYKDLEDQLIAIGFDDDHEFGEQVRSAALAVALTIDSYALPDDALDTILEIISSHGRKNLESLPQRVLNGSEWDEFALGNVAIGDFVRVKRDAYDSPTGAKHNGLVGTLGFVKGHRCSVNYIGSSTGKTMKHPMEKLESLRIR